jgi:hypothetical protein
MFKKQVSLLLTVLLVLLVSRVSFAGEQKEDTTKTFGIGFQSSFPAWGLSGMLNLNHKASIQGIFGIIGDLKTYAGRVIYRFNRKTIPHRYNVYGYGMLGAWTYTGYAIEEDYWGGLYAREKTETVFGFGAGAGVEYFFNNFLPEIGWNLEIGIGSVKFKEIDYNFSTFMFGVGAHYYF